MTTATNVEHFSIKTEVFEGPLDLLLDLVEKRKFLINDISLAEVTDEYMARVAQMQAESLPHTAQFVALAATLLLIKSKSLLPVLELTQAEEESIDDLEWRLKRYALFREQAKLLEDVFGKTVLHEKQFVPEKNPLFVTDQYTTAPSLQAAIGDVLVNLPRKEVRPKVRVKPVISLDEMITRLERRVQNSMKLTFSELLEDESEKPTVIVGFLAVLESVKQGSILAAQARRFEDIQIETEKAATPRYY